MVSNIRNMKGNLKNPKGLIMKIRARDPDGNMVHKNEFVMSDLKSVERELRVWKDNFGTPSRVFQKLLFKPVNQEDLDIIKEQVQKRIAKDKETLRKALSK